MGCFFGTPGEMVKTREFLLPHGDALRCFVNLHFHRGFPWGLKNQASHIYGMSVNFEVAQHAHAEFTAQ